MHQLNRYGLLLVLLGSTLVGWIAASNDSLWIDEGRWAYAAMGVEGKVSRIDPSLRMWSDSRNWVRYSDPAKPFYGVFIRVWGKVFGYSERTLRLSNLPWLLVAQFALWAGLRNVPRLRNATVLLVLASPIVWFYLNETSHYVMLFCGTCIVLGVLARLATPEEGLQRLGGRWFWGFGAGSLLLCGSNAMGVPWAGAAFIAALVLAAKRYKVQWTLSVLVPAALTGASMLLLARHYLIWNPTNSGIATGFGLGNLAFAAYELLGFSGLGPSRLSMRGGGMASVYPFVAGLAVLGILLSLVAWVAIRELRRRMSLRLWLTASVYLLLSTGFIVLMSVLTQFRLLGRHLMPLEPVIILGAAVGVTALFKNGRNSGKLLACGFCTVWLASALSLRFATRHARDDYRSAASVAVDALHSGKSVWWAADACTGEYYKVPLTDSSTATGDALLAVNLEEKRIATLTLPDVVVLSKTDVYDASGTISKMVRERSYRNTRSFPAFTIWEKAPDSGAAGREGEQAPRKSAANVGECCIPLACQEGSVAFGIYRL